jgi:hypothetical protein
MDLFRLKDILDSFSEGQYQSKMWAVENISMLINERHDEIFIIGGWYGLLSYLLSEEGVSIPIKNHDIDDMCKFLGQKINYDDNNKTEIYKNVSFETKNGLDSFYTLKDPTDPFNDPRRKIIICTACEHIDQEELHNALLNKHEDILVCLQSNNYYEINSHINCKDTIDDFIESLPLNTILYSGENPWKDEYTRFMVIGR